MHGSWKLCRSGLPAECEMALIRLDVGFALNDWSGERASHTWVTQSVKVIVDSSLGSKRT